jgi:hypothetical protein
VRAELVADRGAGAETADFFRSRPFYDAEEVSHTLRLKGDGIEIAVPLIVREVPGAEALDAISPYGYPGAVTATTAKDPPDPATIDWSATGLVSVFARERIGGAPWLAGARERSLVQVHDPSLPAGIRARVVEQIWRNRRLGYEVELVPGPSTDRDQRLAFHSLYTETMRRAQAAARYLYPLAYFESVLGFERSWLLLAHAGGDVAAGAVLGVSDSVLHYYLGGTAEAHLGDSPFKNVVHAMIELADELGIMLNLGGGVRAGDGLEEFKRGFANSALPFRTHEVVCDPVFYERLGEGRPDADYFPHYRAPA